jgi:hypothetical protein
MGGRGGRGCPVYPVGTAEKEDSPGQQDRFFVDNASLFVDKAFPAQQARRVHG